jgi:uncharacterized protein YjbJ (UPF0337 family)
MRYFNQVLTESDPSCKDMRSRIAQLLEVQGAHLPACCDQWHELSAEGVRREPTLFLEKFMDTDRVKGAGHQVKGAIKEAAGKVTGDKKTQAEGAAEKTAGKVQNAVGGAKDAAREALKK